MGASDAGSQELAVRREEIFPTKKKPPSHFPTAVTERKSRRRNRKQHILRTRDHPIHTTQAIHALHLKTLSSSQLLELFFKISNSPSSLFLFLARPGQRWPPKEPCQMRDRDTSFTLTTRNRRMSSEIRRFRVWCSVMCKKIRKWRVPGKEAISRKSTTPGHN